MLSIPCNRCHNNILTIGFLSCVILPFLCCAIPMFRMLLSSKLAWFANLIEIIYVIMIHLNDPNN